MNSRPPCEVLVEVGFRLKEFIVGQLNHPTVCSQQQRWREDDSLFVFWPTGFHGFQRNGIQGQLQTMFVKDVVFCLALWQWRGRLGPDVLERVSE
jgi:hypothetical protein